MHTPFGPIMQHGYIVADVEKAALEWAEKVGVGPFYVLETQMEDYYYRGVRMPIELKLGFSYWGSVQIELIQQLKGGQTFYADAAKTELGKLNHYAVQVSDLDGLLAARKIGKDRLIQNGSMPGTGVKFAYIERYMPDGFHLELIQSPDGGAGFGAMEMVARAWDGKKPIRSPADLGNDIANLKR